MEEFMDANATLVVPVANGGDVAVAPPAPAVANMDTEEATAAAEAAAAAAATTTMEAPDETLVGIKIAKDFDGVPFMGEVAATRKSKEGPLYKVVYKDGDTEEFFAAEVQVGKDTYVAVQAEQWNKMVDMIEGLDENKLRIAGISSLSDLELFGGNAAKLSGGTPFDNLDIPLLARQGLYVVATYLLNDQVLTKDSDLATIARYNNDKANGNLKQKRSDTGTKRGPRKKKKVVVVKAKKTAKKPRGRPKKSSTTATATTKKVVKRPPPKARKTPAPAKKPRKAPSKKKAEVVEYEGPVKDPIDGIANWPGTASKGWNYSEKKRAGKGNHVDRYWTTPGGKQLRSKTEVQKFFKAMKQTGNNEEEAIKIFKTLKV